MIKLSLLDIDEFHHLLPSFKPVPHSRVVPDIFLYNVYFLNPYPTSPWLWHEASVVILTAGGTELIKVFCEMLYKFTSMLKDQLRF